MPNNMATSIESHFNFGPTIPFPRIRPDSERRARVTQPGKTQRSRSDSTRRVPTSTWSSRGFKLFSAAQNFVGFNTTPTDKVQSGWHSVDNLLCRSQAGPRRSPTQVCPTGGVLVSSRLRTSANALRARWDVALPASRSFLTGAFQFDVLSAEPSGYPRP